MGVPPQPLRALHTSAPSDNDINTWIASVSTSDSCRAVVQEHIEWLTACRADVSELDAEEKEKRTRRYNRYLANEMYCVDDLVMVYQKNEGKLEPRYRGPFRISSVGEHETSFRLRQLDGRRIRDPIHGDQLRLFVSRTGYLALGPNEFELSTRQNLRRRKKEHCRELKKKKKETERTAPSNPNND